MARLVTFKRFYFMRAIILTEFQTVTLAHIKNNYAYYGRVLNADEISLRMGVGLPVISRQYAILIKKGAIKYASDGLTLEMPKTPYVTVCEKDVKTPNGLRDVEFNFEFKCKQARLNSGLSFRNEK